jgi:hypothetical protein
MAAATLTGASASTAPVAQNAIEALAGDELSISYVQYRC